MEVDVVHIADATNDDDATIAAGAINDEDANIAAGETKDEDAKREVAVQQPVPPLLAILAARAIPGDDAKREDARRHSELPLGVTDDLGNTRLLFVLLLLTCFALLVGPCCPRVRGKCRAAPPKV